MNQFKAGDKVKCIEPTACLTKDKIYVVESRDYDNDVYVRNDKGHICFYFNRRFEPYEEPKPVAMSFPNERRNSKSFESSYMDQINNILKAIAPKGVSVTDTQIGGNHYKDMKIQPIDFIVENKIPYREANAIKYIVRHKNKKGAEDIRKAIHYLQMILEKEYPGQ